MSMYRQLWLAIVVSTLLALTGSLLASLLSARSYLETQLSMKNTDNAAALALTEPRSFLPFAHVLFVSLFAFRIAYGYSLTFGASVISVVLPVWFLALSKEKRNSRLARLRLAFEIGFVLPVPRGSERYFER